MYRPIMLDAALGRSRWARWTGNSRARARRAGFTLIELAIVMVVAGLLLVPLIRMAGTAVATGRVERTAAALERASEALVSYAAANGGCLPFAADFEGALPDTGADGLASATPDSGKNQPAGNNNAGDLAWAPLGLTNLFLDGDNLRIQYYVATPYSDGGDNCEAGYRGFQWNPSITYNADGRQIYVYDDDPASGVRTLYEVNKDKILPAGTHPSDGSDVTTPPNQMPLPDPLLQLRRGPDVTAAGSQSDVISSRNVFILIAAGGNNNTVLGRRYVRDSTHKLSGGGDWGLGVDTVDGNLFSSLPNIDAADTANDGDDTLFIMSYSRYRAALAKHGLNMEPVCENTC